ncbi:MAG TPA: histidine phosphatase family protein [Myxococcota bacterium]|nr:histidine phosphatase family protein [Myxococcota bacterium]
MKNLLLLMRHAKSERAETSPSDFERHLNYRGEQQPALIAKQINQLGISIGKALVSPSKRTVETWSLLKGALSYAPNAVFEEDLYKASMENFIRVIADNIDDEHCVLVIGHCPSVIEATEFLTGEFHDFNTADLAILSTKEHSAFTECLKRPHCFRFERMLRADN